MKFLLEMLGMTNQCNIKCSYCDWEKHPYHKMSEEDYVVAEKNIRKTRGIMDKYYPDYCLVQYSGGEPFLYPRIVEMVLNEYYDKWIRLNTNGLILSEDILNKIKKHGKTYLAISIDGCTLESMEPRIGKDAILLEKILDNLDRAIKMDIPVMILCTLNTQNIGEFPTFVNYLEERYIDAIEDGMLALPAHCVTSYSVKHNEIEESAIIDEFDRYIHSEGRKHALLKNIIPHYEHMIYYLRNNDRKVPCKISDWTVSMHFRGNSIVDDCKFLSFGCGMRGVRDLGGFDIRNDVEVEKFINILDDAESEGRDGFRFKKYDVGGEKECSTKCFPDWIMFDLILTGKADMQAAQDWFVLFRDQRVCNFISNFVEKKAV